MSPALAFIPSPSRGVLHLGPLPLHMYGLMLAIGVLVAARIAEWRWARMGKDPAVIGEMGLWVVIAGVIGARVYHLFTGYDWTRGGIAGTVKIWQGGLSIWGAVAGGGLAVLVLARRRRLDSLALADAIGPGVAVAQAIGRWGNWWNQELFGKPTTVPWALKIDLAHRPAGYTSYSTFQPTFLYESLWCLAIFGVVLWAERRFRFRRGQSFALYVAMYTAFRVWMEDLRIDKATKILGGLRFNGLLSAVLCVLAIVWFVWLGRHTGPSPIWSHASGRAGDEVAGGEIGLAPAAVPDAGADDGDPVEGTVRPSGVPPGPALDEGGAAD